MEKKYRLLKDLPGARAGTIFKPRSRSSILFNGADDSPLFYERSLELHSDWFEKIDEKKYTEGDMYAYASWYWNKYLFAREKAGTTDMQTEVEKCSLKHWIEEKNNKL